jgi:hypothetical protein
MRDSVADLIFNEIARRTPRCFTKSQLLCQAALKQIGPIRAMAADSVHKKYPKRLWRGFGYALTRIALE